MKFTCVLAAALLVSISAKKKAKSNNKRQPTGPIKEQNYEWQKLGACGVPTAQPSSDLFAAIPDGHDKKKKAKRGGRMGRIKRGIGRIVGGRPSAAHTWPWQAYIHICGKWYGQIECNICGGSIISPTWMVSAAHCVPEGPSGHVIHGTHKLNSSGRKTMLANFIQHPEWDIMTFNFDISLFQTRTRMEITANTSPICLPHASTCFDYGTACVVTGFGLTSETGGFPDTLHEVAVRLIPFDVCARYERYGELLTDNMMCAGYDDGGKDACAGDSGGPLVCRMPKTHAWILYGVVSWGYGCARPNNPGVYTKVTNMLGFIEENTRDGENQGIIPDPNLEIEECYERGNSEANWSQGKVTSVILDQLYDNSTGWQSTLEKPKENISEQLQSTCDYSFTSGGMYSYTYDEDSTELGRGSIQSVGYPKEYPQNIYCEYKLRNNVKGYYVKVTVTNSRVDCKRGAKDILAITSSGGRLYKVCKVKRHVNIKDTKGFDIVFKSDRINRRGFTGFKLKWIIQDATHMCAQPTEQVLRSSKQVMLYTENFPKPYSKYSQCRWHFTTTGSGFIMNIHRFRTERGPCTTKNDNLVVFIAKDCNTDTYERDEFEIWGTICGTTNKQKRFKIEGQSICVMFLADGDRYRSYGARFTMIMED